MESQLLVPEAVPCPVPTARRMSSNRMDAPYAAGASHSSRRNEKRKTTATATTPMPTHTNCRSQTPCAWVTTSVCPAE